MLPVLWRCRSFRLLPEDRSSALFTELLLVLILVTVSGVSVFVLLQ
ncbi:putative membrane protein [Escherichia coli P0299438.10]|uniref:Uncharacterized protein n=1 Tax=Escherichia coli H386 TaxID=656397 RepID=A0A1X3J4G9_ECOLX|nr:hypothetical protein EcHS_A2133 [Escherichia coli HS]AKM35573.1 hypothetical protein PCN061_2084 [Escherichia coli PCN061]AOM48365.1 hypothetical protein FORC28_5389 [Escherichia coli]EFZ43627.1 putative membrane protein [Escherichia coli EPECa14]EHW07007.1 putative membrane protein [Escherichia coli DEC8C]EHW56027.1 putative membrane protein [Escherichia coli DEC10A]EHW67195.1 putative membrane protein [Escherichia coli DEC10C]EHW72634.1 putative membrane protein [Escherichia coli DEC10D